MRGEKFRGVGVALVTPFNDDCSVDYAALGNLVEYTIEGGVDYLVVLGTTGESATLTPAERAEVLRFCVDKAAGRLPIVYGYGGNNTDELLKGFDSIDFKGVDAILSVSPYYNKPSQEGLYRHFAAIAQKSPVPVILYNVPGRTGSNMSADTTLRLARDFENIVAIKEASGNMAQAAHIAACKPEGFGLISGDDNLTLAMIAQGGQGTISVAANAFPETFCRMTHAALEGRSEEARENFFKLLDATEALFADGNPAGVKAALAYKGIINNVLRLPLAPASNATQTKLAELIDKYGI